MRPGRGKLTASIAIAGALALVVWLVCLLRHRLLESWRFRELGSPNTPSEPDALEPLVNAGSARVIPWLFHRARLGKLDAERFHSLVKRSLEARGQGGPQDLAEDLCNEPWPLRVALYHELRLLNVPPAYLEGIALLALDDPDPAVKRWGIEGLAGLPSIARPTIHRLQDLGQETDADVRLWADLAVKRFAGSN